MNKVHWIKLGEDGLPMLGNCPWPLRGIEVIVTDGHEQTYASLMLYNGNKIWYAQNGDSLTFTPTHWTVALELPED
jgi:hypothetical protein